MTKQKERIMEPIKFKEQNTVFNKPSSMTDEECGSLPCFVDRNERYPQIISCWKLSEEEMIEIQKTGIVWVSVYANGLPPMAIMTEKPLREIVIDD